MSHPRCWDFALASGAKSRADLEVRNGLGFIALLEAFRATGGTAPAAIANRLLEERQGGSAVSLATLLNTDQAFGFEWRAGLWIPMFQFGADDLALNVGVQRIRSELPSQWSGWTLASWFAAPNVQLDGRTPVDTFDSNPDAVVRAACSLGTVDESSSPRVRRAREVAVHA